MTSTTLYAFVTDPQAQGTNYLIDSSSGLPIEIPADNYLKYIVLNKAQYPLTTGKNIVVRLENDITLIKQSDSIDTTMLNTAGVKSTLGIFKNQITANRKVIMDVSGDVSGSIDISIKFEPF
jgi:hypothetical protein